MEKKNIFKKIDDIYTKTTKFIIGDIPHDGDAPQKKSKNVKEIGLKNKLVSLKDKFLTLGTPDEKSVLYTEIVKKEKQEVTQVTKEESPKVSPNQTSLKKPTPTKTKATVEKKTSLEKVSTKKPITQKKVADNAKRTKEVTTSKTKKAKKVTATKKKSIAKSTITETKKTEKTPAKKSNTKKVTVSKKDQVSTNKTKVKKTTEASSKPKTKSAPRGAQKAAKIALYIKDIKKHYGEVDEDFVTIIVNNLGPSIYKKDAELVSCSDPKELDTVRKSFLKKKLGIDASKGVLDAAIQDVCIELKGVRNKYRATFYYALAKKFKKESVLS